MELDLNKFRTLIPISALYDESLLFLARHTRVDRLSRDDLVFDIGDDDPDSIFLISGDLMQGLETGGKRQTTLAELGPCDGFGEEALISDTTRNANVTAPSHCRS